jgi:copper chaperone CopZ
MRKTILVMTGLLLAGTALAAPTRITATVNGMVCGFCAQGITKKLNAEPAVSKVDVSLEKKVVMIDLKEGKSLDDQTIEKILKDSGYNVEKIVRN